MVKITKKDYPWTIIIEDKVSKNNNPYISIGIGFTEKNPQATCDAEKYKTEWFNLVRLEDLLKLSSDAENIYQQYKFKKEAERTAAKGQSPQAASSTAPAYADLDNDLPI